MLRLCAQALICGNAKNLFMEIIEDLQCGGMKFIQSSRCFKFGTDGVLLANFARVKRGQTAVDLGTGTGIIPVLLCAKTKGNFIGIEIQTLAAEYAKKNAELNGLCERFRVICADMKDAKEHIKEHVDVVISNPPYDADGSGKKSATTEHKIARHEEHCTLEEVVKTAASLLKTGGVFYTINRASRTGELLHLMQCSSLVPKELRFIAPALGKEPKFVLAKAVMNAGQGMRILPTLYVSDGQGNYTEEMRQIYSGQQ